MASVSAVPRYKVAEETMLDAACAVFAAEGFENSNMETIAAVAGTTKPTLYARFGSKEGLFGAAVGREYELLKQRLFATYAAGEDEPFHLRLRRWNAAYFDFARERPDGFRLSSEGERHPAAAAIIQRANDEIVDRVAELVVSVSGRHAGPGPRLVAAMICGMMTWCAKEAVRRGPVDIGEAARLAESFLSVAMRGLDTDLMAAIGQPPPRPRRRRGPLPRRPGH